MCDGGVGDRRRQGDKECGDGDGGFGGVSDDCGDGGDG